MVSTSNRADELAEVRILIGGDVCPRGSIAKAFSEARAEDIFHDLSEDIRQSDLSIVNLECPLVSQHTPICKSGPVLDADVRSIRGLVAARWDVINLANNHSFDHGARGLQETIEVVKGAGLSVVGAGSDLSAARIPFSIEIKGKRIVIYAMAEHEFSIADEKTAGANPLDVINFVKAVAEYKRGGIFIVLIHGGNEYYGYPSPEMMRRCRFMVDMGADAVICCHTHCPLPWEIYRDHPILYGLGNLIFEPASPESDAWHNGYLARIKVGERQLHFDVIPYIQSKGHSGAWKMKGEVLQSFFAEMKNKGGRIKDAAFIEDNWLDYCRTQKNDYLPWLFGYNRWMLKLRALLLPMLHSEVEVRRALLLTQCEAHQEILHTLLKDYRTKEL